MWFSNDEYKRDQQIRERQHRLELQQAKYLDMCDEVLKAFGPPARRAPATSPHSDDPIIESRDVAQMEKWFAKDAK